MPRQILAEIITIKKTCENPAPTMTSAVRTTKQRILKNVNIFVTNIDR